MIVGQVGRWYRREKTLLRLWCVGVGPLFATGDSLVHTGASRGRRNQGWSAGARRGHRRRRAAPSKHANAPDATIIYASIKRSAISDGPGVAHRRGRT